MKNDIENKIILSGGVIELDKYIDSAHFIIKNDTTMNAINLHSDKNFKFTVLEDAALTINMFDYAIEENIDIDVELNDKSSFILNDSFISEVKYNLNIDVKLYGSNIYTYVNIRGINEKNGVVRVSMNGTVAGETKGNSLNEFAKIINRSELSNVIIPNMIVNTSEVEANHGVSVSAIDEEELFYLLSKGLDKHHATKLIEEGFLLSIMNDDKKEQIKNILVGR